MSGEATGVRLTGIRKSFGPVRVVEDISLEVRQGEFLTLLGPSGCGKTTVLNLIAGFFPVDAGRIEIAGQDVTGVLAYQRNTAMVFQNYALFPHLDVFGNVAFGLRMREKRRKAEIRRKVSWALRLVKMEGMEGRFPRQVSGGQQQRVALARALVVEPAVLLLDEPLSNLDAKLREEMRLELRQLQRTLGITTIFVTHDQEEAFAVSDRVAVLHGGRIEQLGTPGEIYRAPATATVATFIGRMNWLPGQIVEPGVFLADLGAAVGSRIPVPTDRSPGTVGHLLVRPEHVRLSAIRVQTDIELEGKVEARVYLGPVTHYHVRVGSTLVLAYGAAGTAVPSEGDVVYVSWSFQEARFMPLWSD